jgi:hypothetical protein
MGVQKQQQDRGNWGQRENPEKHLLSVPAIRNQQRSNRRRPKSCLRNLTLKNEFERNPAKHQTPRFPIRLGRRAGGHAGTTEL